MSGYKILDRSEEAQMHLMVWRIADLEEQKAVGRRQKAESRRQRESRYCLCCLLLSAFCLLFFSVVVFKTKMCNQILSAQVAQSVLELHQLNEDVVLRVKTGRGLRRFEVEGEPFLNAFHPGPLR